MHMLQRHARAVANTQQLSCVCLNTPRAISSQKMHFSTAALILLTSSVVVHVGGLGCGLHWGQIPENARAFEVCEQVNNNSSSEVKYRHVVGSRDEFWARGVQAGGSMRRMLRFAKKVLEGGQISVGVAGGSFSTGQSDEERKGGCALCSAPNPCHLESNMRCKF